MGVSLHVIDKELLLKPCKGPGFIRQSAIKDTERCARKGLFAHIYGLRPIGRIGVLDRGSYAHKAVKTMVVKGSVEAARREAEGLRARVVENLKDGSKDGTIPFKLERDMTKNAAVGLAMGMKIAAEVANYKELGTLVPVAVEHRIEFARRVNGELYEGSIQLDLLMRDRRNNYWVWDTKTHDGDPMQFVNEFRRSVQARLYVEEARVAVKRGEIEGVPSNAKVVGALIGVIRTPSIRITGVGTPKEETVADYVERCGTWWDGTGKYANKRADRISNPSYVVKYIPIGPEVDRGFERRLERYVSQMTEPRALENFPPTETSCHANRSTCIFARICDEDTEAGRRRAVEEHYRIDPDPLDSAIEDEFGDEE